MVATNLNPIEVSVRDAKAAHELLNDAGFSFENDGSTIFIFTDDEQWNDCMELFENNNIELY